MNPSLPLTQWPSSGQGPSGSDSWPAGSGLWGPVATSVPHPPRAELLPMTSTPTSSPPCPSTYNFSSRDSPKKDPFRSPVILLLLRSLKAEGEHR